MPNTHPKTYGEKLDNILEAILETCDNENQRILISRLLQDKQFKVDFLSLLTTLMASYPELLQTLNESVVKVRINQMLNDLGIN